MLGKIVLVSGKSVEHLGCALGVADVGNLLVSGLCDDVVYHSWQVVLAHLLPVKSPIFGFILVMVVRGMSKTVGVASTISKPDIITSTGGNECRSNVFPVHDPSIGRIKYTMLHKNSRFSMCWVSFPIQSWNAPHCELVAILSYNGVRLKLKTVLHAHLLEGKLSIARGICVCCSRNKS